MPGVAGQLRDVWRHARHNLVQGVHVSCLVRSQVTQNGLVSTLPGFRHFPDTKADVTGKKIQVSCAPRSTLLLLTPPAPAA